MSAEKKTVTTSEKRKPKGGAAKAIPQEQRTERSTRQALHEKEQHLASIYEEAAEAMFYLLVEPGGQYRFDSVNPAFLNITGLTYAQVTGRRVSEVIPEPSLSLVLGKYSQAIREKTIVRWEEISDYPTGRLAGDVSVAPVFDEDGHCTHLVGSVHDITERKQAEQALRESEEKFKHLFEDANVGKSITQFSGGIQVNRALADWLGFTQEELQNKNWQEITHPDDIALTQREADRLLSGETQAARFNKRFLKKDGSVVWGDLRSSVLIDPQGKPLYMMTTIVDITERMGVEEALRVSEERYHLVFENSGTANTLFDKECRVVLQNSLSKKLTMPMEAIGKTALEVFGPEQGPAVTKRMRRVLASGKPEEFETEFTLPAGTRWMHSSYQPLLDKQQNVMGVQVISQDITERKQAEILQKAVYQIATAAETTSTLEELYPQIHQIISSVMPAENFFITVYDEAENMLRFPYFKNAADEPFMGGIHPARGLTAYVLRTGKSLLCDQEAHDELERLGEIKLLGAPSAIWLGVPLMLGGRAIGAMVVQHYSDPKAYGEREQHMLEFVSSQVAVAINRKQAEEALRSSETKFRTIAEQMTDMIYVTDDQSTITFASPAVESLFGCTPTEMLGRHFTDFLTENDISKANKAYSQALSLGKPSRNLELGMKRIDGSHFIGELNGALFRIGDKVVGTIGIIRDITDRKQAEEALQNYNLRLEAEVDARTRELLEAQEKLVRNEKLAVLGQLAGGVGHELRNPLGVINTAIYYLKMIQPDANEKVKRNHDIIEQEIRNADKIITDLLDFALIKSLEREPVQVKELVQRTLYRFPAPPTVLVTLDLPTDLPDVYADLRQMEQVLGNLVTNGCQAMKDGGPLTVRAEKVSGDNEKWVRISVTDTGTGITPENMKMLFEPLFTTKAKGIGLGLAVSRMLAEANGGRIEVESEPGKGSTFTLVLPMKP
jgi:PAS domain S-box-containing protein